MDDEAMLLAVIRSNPDVLAPRKMLADLYRERCDDVRANLWASEPHGASPFASLVGQPVLSVWLNETSSALYIETPGRWFEYLAEGDCCSWSWWYRVRGLAALVGHTVHAIAAGRCEGVDVKDGLCQQEEDDANEYVLLTEAGGCEVCFRNSSNGYYSGFLTVAQHDERPEQLGEELKADWTHPPAAKADEFGCSRAGDGACQCVECLFPGVV